MAGLIGNGKKMIVSPIRSERREEKLIKQIKEKILKKRKAIDETTTTNSQISPVVHAMKQWVQLHDAAAEDSDWLNPKKKTKGSPAAYDSSCSMSTCWPPRAHHLPHVDTFALPYAIPF